MNEIASLIRRYRKGWSLEQDFYLNPKVLEIEQQALWNRNWLFAGFTCEIPEAGDYFTYTVINQSVIIIKGDEGEIYAHHNTCRHRGSVICLEERGNEPKLKCPYHNWVYEKNGNLRNARLMPDNFDKSEFGLFPVKVSILEGVIFISFSETPPDFSREMTDLSSYLAPYQLDRAKVAYRDRYELDANWKLIAENFRECYHCGPAHIEYCNAVVGANLVEEREELWTDQNASWLQKGLALGTIEKVDGACHFAIRYPLRRGIESYSINGKPVAPVMGAHQDYDNGVVGLINYPNFWMDGVSDYIWVMRITPINSTRSVVDLFWLLDGKAVEGVDYDLDRLTEFWKITGEQDWHLCENNQKGVNSPRYRPGPMAPSEIDVVNFHQWYLDTLQASLQETIV